MALEVTDIAFVGYPVTEIERARAFYGGLLGLRCVLDHPLPETGQRWLEYEIGTGTLALSNAWPPSGQSGPTVALEVKDLDAAIAHLRARDVAFESDVIATPVCRFILLNDPDDNGLMLHQRAVSSPEN